MLLELIKDVLSRRKDRTVDIINTNNVPQKILEIITFGEACKLRNVVQPDIHHALYASPLQPGKKVLGVLVGESDGADSHVVPVD